MWKHFENPNPHIQGEHVNKCIAAKLSSLPCFEAFCGHILFKCLFMFLPCMRGVGVTKKVSLPTLSFWGVWGSRMPKIGDSKITSTSTEGQKRSQNLAPVLVIISGNSLVFSWKLLQQYWFLHRCCAPGASAPVVV